MLPDGYKKLDEYKLTRDLAITMQFLGGAASILVFYLFQQLADFSLLFWNAQEINFDWYILLPITLMVFIIHELVHGIGVKWAGGKPKYGVGLAFWILPYFYCTSDQYFPRNKFLFFAALPTVVLTLVGICLTFFLPQFSQLFVIGFTANFVGGVGDCWLIGNVLRYPKHVLILDQKNSNTIYGKETDTPLLQHKEVSVPVAFLKGIFEGLMYFFFISIFLGIALSIGSHYNKNLPGTPGEVSFTFSLPLLVVIVAIIGVVRARQARQNNKKLSAS